MFSISPVVVIFVVVIVVTVAEVGHVDVVVVGGGNVVLLFGFVFVDCIILVSSITVVVVDAGFKANLMSVFCSALETSSWLLSLNLNCLNPLPLLSSSSTSFPSFASSPSTAAAFSRFRPMFVKMLFVLTTPFGASLTEGEGPANNQPGGGPKRRMAKLLLLLLEKGKVPGACFLDK